MTEEKKEEQVQEKAEEGLKKTPATFRTIFGEKVGMSQIYRNDGRLCGVTLVKVGPCPVLRVKSAEGKDGYNAVQLAYGQRREKNLSKSRLGAFKAAGVSAARFVREVRVNDIKGIEIGQTVVVDGLFKPGDYVDVQATSKGKGFAGVMKRHNFHGMPASHGSSDKERSPGSIASRRSLGRVLPGQKMAGRMGGDTVSVLKLEVIKVDPRENMLYLLGAVPGPRKALVRVCETTRVKKVRPELVKSHVKRDKMGNIIKTKKPTQKKA